MVDKYSKSNRERKKDSNKNGKEIYNSKHIRIKFNNVSKGKIINTTTEKENDTQKETIATKGKKK